MFTLSFLVSKTTPSLRATPPSEGNFPDALNVQAIELPQNAMDPRLRGDDDGGTHRYTLTTYNRHRLFY